MVPPGYLLYVGGANRVTSLSGRATVERFHAAALGAGGQDNGAPGERPYHPGYYAAFVHDPDGNNIEVVYHGPAKRSAESIRITF